jgi:hypothetical protein
MTEAEWLASTDPQKMLELVKPRTSSRKLRLLACACVRHVPEMAGDERDLSALDSYKAYADGLVSTKAMNRVLRGARWDSGQYDWRWQRRRYAEFDVSLSPRKVNRTLAELTRLTRARGGEEIYQVTVLRDLFGNPFRPVTVDPAWLSWNDGAISKLAQSVFDNRDLPSGHFDNHRRPSSPMPWRTPAARTRTSSTTAAVRGPTCAAAG